jgi:Glycosyl transferase family 2
MSKHTSPRKRVRRRVPSTPRGRPSVTVMVPAYNYARYLPECADSVLSQRDVDVRLIVVDDCSPDETPEVTAKLAADPRVTAVRNEPNIGHIPSVNRGFGMVDTEYVVKLDADDLLAPGALARATALLEAHPEVGFVYGRPQHFTGEPPASADAPSRSWTIWSGRDWLEQRCRTGVNAISQPEVVIRTSLLWQAMPIREELPHTSDLHLWMQLSSMGDVARVNGPAQGYYREHDASMQRTVNSGRMFDLRGRRDAFDSAFAAQAAAVPGARELHELARRTLAQSALDRACRAYERGRTAEEPVDELVAYALETCPDARELREWGVLERRRSIGPARAPRDPRCMTAALVRRAFEEVSRRRWLATGEIIGPR